MIVACSGDAKGTTEGATAKNGEQLFIQNAKTATVILAVAFAGQELQIATLWAWAQEKTSPVPRKIKSAARCLYVVLRRKKALICASINVRVAIAIPEEKVQSAGQMFLRVGLTAELEQRKTVLHAKVSSAVMFLHTASAQTFRFDLIANILSFDSFIGENSV
jgi:hypothetical protein